MWLLEKSDRCATTDAVERRSLNESVDEFMSMVVVPFVLSARVSEGAFIRRGERLSMFRPVLFEVTLKLLKCLLSARDDFF